MRKLGLWRGRFQTDSQYLSLNFLHICIFALLLYSYTFVFFYFEYWILNYEEIKFVARANPGRQSIFVFKFPAFLYFALCIIILLYFVFSLFVFFFLRSFVFVILYFRNDDETWLVVRVDPRQTVNNGMIWNNTDIDDAEPSQSIDFGDWDIFVLTWCLDLETQQRLNFKNDCVRL